MHIASTRTGGLKLKRVASAITSPFQSFMPSTFDKVYPQSFKTRLCNPEFHLYTVIIMPRTIPRGPFIEAPRRQLASKAARKSAPSTGGPILPSKAARKSALSAGPSQYGPERAELERAERGSRSTPSSSIIALTDSPPTSTTPPSHKITTAAVSLDEEELKRTISTVSEQNLRSAILKVCTESVETAKLLGPLLTPSALGTLDKKRKRSPEICD